MVYTIMINNLLISIGYPLGPQDGIYGGWWYTVADICRILMIDDRYILDIFFPQTFLT